MLLLIVTNISRSFPSEAQKLRRDRIEKVAAQRDAELQRSVMLKKQIDLGRKEREESVSDLLE